MTRATSCSLCGASAFETLLDLGRQPMASHFKRSPDEADARYPLAWGCCSACGLSQLAAPLPDEALSPIFPWLGFREPEDHLDTVVARIMALPGLSGDPVVGGVSPKDDSTLERLQSAGARFGWRVDPRADLGAENAAANVETVQARLDSDQARRLAVDKGVVDVLIARHIVEHCASPLRFLAALSDLLAVGGYLVIEVPDCAANMKRRDYTMIWEEHALYLTEKTAQMLLEKAGCALVEAHRYTYPFEDVLVLIGRKESGAAPRVEAHGVDALFDNAKTFAEDFSRRTQLIRQDLSARLSPGQGIALYGAGHLSCAFVNFHRLTDLCDVVIDDTPEKQGLSLAGTGLPIKSAAALDVQLHPICLLTLSPAIEDRIVARHSGYTDGGGEFFSALVDSRHSIWKQIT
jgi:hypothetical protein